MGMDESILRNQLISMCKGLSKYVIFLDPGEELRNVESIENILTYKYAHSQDSLFSCSLLETHRSSWEYRIMRNDVSSIYYQYPIRSKLTCDQIGQFSVNDELIKTDFQICQFGVLVLPIPLPDSTITPFDPAFVRILIDECNRVGDTEKVFQLCEQQIATYQQTQLPHLVYYDNYYHALVNLGLAYAQIGNETFYRWLLKAQQHSQLLQPAGRCEPLYFIALEYQRQRNNHLAYMYARKSCEMEMPRVFARDMVYYPRTYLVSRWELLRDLSMQVNQLSDHYRARDHLGRLGEKKMMT